MSEWSAALLGSVRRGLAERADPERATQMAAYMRDQFPFFGVSAKDRKAVLRKAMAALPEPSVADVEAFARASFAEPERELHNTGVFLMRRKVRLLGPRSMPCVHHLVTTHSWWDTVDELAAHVAGGIVSRHPDTALAMDEWVRSDDMWVARTAILHQLRFKEATDATRLFDYCLLRAVETDFFYRKAIGWALREYAKTDPSAVREFCADNSDRLSPLSMREATKHL